MKIAAIVVNHRTPDLTARAVTALLGELDTVGSPLVYLVGDDSGDGSLDRLRQAERETWGERVVLIASGNNGGYGHAINVGFAAAMGRSPAPEYIYVLDSDAFVEPGSLRKLVSFMDGQPRAGLAGSTINGADGTRVSAFRFPTPLSELGSESRLDLIARLLPEAVVALPEPAETTEVDWISAVSVLIRRAVLEQIGGFDEGLSSYFQEVDFCRRARRAGWRSYYVAQAPISHTGCVSTRLSGGSLPMPASWFASRSRYFLKHHGRLYAALCDLGWATGTLLRRTRGTVLGNPGGERPAQLEDFIRHGARQLTRLALPGPDDCVLGDPPPRDPGLLDLLAEDFATYDRDPFTPGFWAVAAHRCAARAAQVRSPALRAVALQACRAGSGAVDLLWGIHLPRTVALGRRVRIWHFGCVVLDARSIGDDVHLRQCTTLGPLRGDETDPEELPVIEDRADLGAGVCVLGPVTVGHDARIGANTVVMRDVPPDSTMLGVPARPVATAGLSGHRSTSPEDASSGMPVGDRDENPPGIGLLALLAEDFRWNGGTPLSPGFCALAVHRFGNWRMGIRIRPLRAAMSLLYELSYRTVVALWGIDLPYVVKVGRRLRIGHHGAVLLGARAIGDNVRIRHAVTLGVRARTEVAVPTIGDGVEIGPGACIVGAVHVGAGSFICANTVLTLSVPPGSTVLGVPGRVVDLDQHTGSGVTPPVSRAEGDR
jgi:N-acetylglucosaminyl-diphospho-decaprenol L-rhamnosyltransferase